MKTCILLLGLAWLGAGEAPPPRDIGTLHDQFIEALEPARKRAALDDLSRTRPATMRDVKWLFDLLTRFPEPAVREAVMASVGLLDPGSAHLEPAFIEYLKLPENEAVIFGVRGALRLRTPRALPIIEKIARRRFPSKSPGESPVLSDRNAWWVVYEALSVLAQWQGAQALPLLRRKAGEAPAVARLMAQHLWPESLPQIASWAAAGGSAAERVHEAFSAEVPNTALRATRAEMLKLVRGRKTQREFRHQLALKIGFCSTDEEIDALISEAEAEPDAETRLMLSAALFASRSPRTTTWLKKQAQEHLEANIRIGALTQLRAMLPAAESRLLIEWSAAHDPAQENRELAAGMLKTP